MKIKKIGHCCFVVETLNSHKVMTDPGSFSVLQNNEKGLDIVLITHEHRDHLHIDSLKQVIVNNPNIKIITNTSVGRILESENIEYIKVEEGDQYVMDDITIKGFGNLHAEIFNEYGRVQNTGYMINNLCYAGDSFSYPDYEVDILALPVAGPWMKMKDAVEYAKNIKPRVCFPVHDAIVQDFAKFTWNIPLDILTKDNIKFIKLEIGKTQDI